MKYDKIKSNDNMKVTKVDAEIVKDRVPLKMITKSTKPKRGLISRLVNGVMGPNGFKKMRDNLVEEIVKPALKRVLYEGITSTAGLLLYQDGTAPRGAGRTSEFVKGARAVDYSSLSTSKAAGTIRTVHTNNYAVEYAIPDRIGVADVLNNLQRDAKEFGSVSVADYYDMIGAASAFTDHNYGWTSDSLSHTTVRPVREGYIIQFPPLELLR